MAEKRIRRSKKQVIIDLITKSFGEVKDSKKEIDQIVSLLDKLEEKRQKKDKKKRKLSAKQFARSKTADELKEFATALLKIANDKESEKTATEN